MNRDTTSLGTELRMDLTWADLTYREREGVTMLRREEKERQIRLDYTQDHDASNVQRIGIDYARDMAKAKKLNPGEVCYILRCRMELDYYDIAKMMKYERWTDVRRQEGGLNVVTSEAFMAFWTRLCRGEKINTEEPNAATRDEPPVDPMFPGSDELPVSEEPTPTETEKAPEKKPKPTSAKKAAAKKTAARKPGPQNTGA